MAYYTYEKVYKRTFELKVEIYDYITIFQKKSNSIEKELLRD